MNCCYKGIRQSVHLTQSESLIFSVEFVANLHKLVPFICLFSHLITRWNEDHILVVDWPLIRQEIGKLSPKLIAPSLLCPVNWYGATRSCHTRCLAPWWRHDMGTLSALLTLCMGNTRKGTIMCGVFSVISLLSKQAVEQTVDLSVI